MMSMHSCKTASTYFTDLTAGPETPGPISRPASGLAWGVSQFPNRQKFPAVSYLEAKIKIQNLISMPRSQPPLFQILHNLGILGYRELPKDYLFLCFCELTAHVRMGESQVSGIEVPIRKGPCPQALCRTLHHKWADLANLKHVGMGK